MNDEVDVDFGTENLSEGLEPFVGKILFAQFNCNCENCRAGEAALAEQGESSSDRPRIHIKIRPDEDEPYDKDQNLWATVSKTVDSAWGQLQKALEQLNIVKEVERDVSFLEGKKFLWERKTYEVGFQEEEKDNWLPVEMVD